MKSFFFILIKKTLKDLSNSNLINIKNRKKGVFFCVETLISTYFVSPSNLKKKLENKKYYV